MHKVVILHLLPFTRPDVEFISLLGQKIEVTHIDCQGNLSTAISQIHAHDGQVAAIGITGVARSLELGQEHIIHDDSQHIFSIAKETAIVDGTGIIDAVERWATRLVDEQEPGIWSQKQVLMAPGLNHVGLSEALQAYTPAIRYADPLIYFDLPPVPGVGNKESLVAVARPTLKRLKEFPYRELFPDGQDHIPTNNSKPFDEAQIIAGDIGAILRFAPEQLDSKTVATTHVSAEDVQKLRQRNVSILITLLPNLSHDARKFAHHTPAEVEACLAALQTDNNPDEREHNYLTLLADLHWKPAVRYLKPEEAKTSKFAYITQPNNADHLKKTYRWTAALPSRLLTRTAAYIPPVFLGHVQNISSKTSDQQAEATLLMLGGTPEEFAQRDSDFVYRRLLRAARMAEQLGARLMGVSAFSDKMGEASEMVSHKTGIAITSGRNLSAAATLEAGQSAVLLMGNVSDLRDATVLITNASQESMGACARYIAPKCPNLILTDSRPEKLITLKKQIEQENPNASISISTSIASSIHKADIILATETALENSGSERPFELALCKPGAVICDLSRPTSFSQEEADLRPDLLIIHAGKFRMPGNPSFGFDFGLPDGLIHPSFVEAAVLSIENRFQDFSIGNSLSVEKLREIITLTHRHGFVLDGLRSYQQILTPDDIAQRRDVAERLKNDPLKMNNLVHENRQALQKIDQPSLIPTINRGNGTLVVAGLGVFAVIAGLIGWIFTRRKKDGA